MGIEVVYEDSWLLIANKPAGLLTIPTPKKERRTLTNLLNEYLMKDGAAFRLHPCHRLDRETSGLIIYAKGKSAQKKMAGLFKQRQVKKTYVAFVQGALPRNEGRIDHPVEGLSSLTEYKVIRRERDFTVVEVAPLTGRTNQIRIHFKLIGHPVVGERKYAFRKDFKLKANRLCLHAKRLEFIHPVTGKKINLSIDLPEDLRRFLDSGGHSPKAARI